MTVDKISLNISTPAEPIAPGRGFYQLEEESLFVQIGPFAAPRRFFSFLDSDGVRMDFDRHGRLIFVELAMPRRRWSVQPRLSPPQIVEAADIRWLNFRDLVARPRVFANDRKTIVKMAFSEVERPLNYYVAESVILQTDQDFGLAALWVTDITDDIAGQEISAFRKIIRGRQATYA